MTENRHGSDACLGDETLWSRCLRGDGEAFGVLFDRHRDRVFSAALRLVEGRHDAEDVAASAFLELWRRRQDVRVVNGSILAWLLVTATNLARNLARGRRRYRNLLDRLPRERDAPDTATVVLEARGLGSDGQLRAAIRRLSVVDAQLVALVALEGFPLAAAAEVLGLSESSARSRFGRARRRLKDHLGPADGPTEQGIPGGSA